VIPTIEEPHKLIVLRAILLAGSCPSASSVLANVYLLSISYAFDTGSNDLNAENSNLTAMFAGAVGNSHLTIRTGYFGICAKGGNEISWTCGKTRHNLIETVGDNLKDPLGLLDISIHFREHAVSPGLM
jgi:hypothetical protein